METLKPSSLYRDMTSNWAAIGTEGHHGGAPWTEAENKMFEDALAVHDGDTPDRWHKVAAMIPGKTVADVIHQYNQLVDDISNIEAGLVPIPGYNCNFRPRPALPPHLLEWGEGGFDGFRQCFVNNGGGKRSRPSDQERKKGIPWTEKEHKLFLLGLKKHGKGDWRNISRNFVITRTPTQVASHAQKYYARQLSGGKDKRRASIHDITTVNLNDNPTPSPENQNHHSPDHMSVLPHRINSISRSRFQRNDNTNNFNTNNKYQNNGMESGFHPTNRDLSFMSPYNNGMNSSGSFQYVGMQSMGFQMNPAHLYPRG